MENDLSGLCKNCKTEKAVKYSQYSRGEFCSRKCANSFSTKEKRQEINEKVSKKLKGRENPGGRPFQKGHDPRRYLFTDDDRKVAAKTRSSEFRIEDKLTKNSTLSNEAVTRILVEKNIMAYECDVCALTEWQGKFITLELDHKNGDRHDNRIENLHFLCPNCHSQTPNFRGKNINNGQKKVSDDDMINALNSHTSIRQALIALKLAPRGGNYFRAKLLLNKQAQ